MPTEGVVNPNQVSFPASTDHALVTTYELGLFRIDYDIQVQSVDLGKPTPDGSNMIVAPVNPNTLDVGRFFARVRANSAEGPSAWSEMADLFFDVQVAPPGKPVLARV